jgi:hypothetical protein
MNYLIVFAIVILIHVSANHNAVSAFDLNSLKKLTILKTHLAEHFQGVNVPHTHISDLNLM